MRFGTPTTASPHNKYIAGEQCRMACKSIQLMYLLFSGGQNQPHNRLKELLCSCCRSRYFLPVPFAPCTQTSLCCPLSRCLCSSVVKASSNMAATPSASKQGAGSRSSSVRSGGVPASSLARHVKAALLALGKEKRVLASYTHWDREEPLPYREKLQAILNSSGAKPSKVQCTFACCIEIH